MYFHVLKDLYEMEEKASKAAEERKKSKKWLMDATREENIRRLALMGSMEKNWDGYGGKPFEESTISHFGLIIHTISHQTEILPTNMGAMGMIYRKPDGSYMEFEVFPDRIEMFSMLPDDMGRVRAIAEDNSTNFVSFINGWLRVFYGSDD